MVASALKAFEHLDDESLVYVGHTTSFNKRKTQHKSSCCNDKDRNYNLKVYQMIRENGGWEMFKMLEVEKYPCNDKREAERREDEIMKELKANMNTKRSYRTEEENKLYMEEYNKNYYEIHREKIQEKTKEYFKTNKPKMQEQKKEYYIKNKPKLQEKEIEYRKANKAKIQENKKEYRETNKESIQEYMDEYREANRATINAKVKCECGCEVMKRHLKEHQTTKKHLNKMKDLNNSIQLKLFMFL